MDAPRSPGKSESRRVATRHLRGLLKMAAVATLTLVSMEAASRMFFHSRLAAGLNWKINTSVLWRMAWVDRHEAHQADVYRPQLDEFDPVLGWRSKPNVRLGEWSTNSLGARGKTDYPYARDPLEKRIVVIGDSFAFGISDAPPGVSDEETYASRLEQLLPETEVINLGIGGYGTDQILLMLKEEGIRYHPDLVIVGVVTDDFDRNLEWFRDYAKPLFSLDEDGSLHLTRTPVPPPERFLHEEPWRSKLLDALETLRAAFEKPEHRQERALRITEALSREIVRTATSSGARVLFLVAPYGNELPAPSEKEMAFKAFAARERFDVLDMGMEMRARFASGEDFGRGHWNSHGHETIAKGLQRRILDERLLARSDSSGQP